MYIIVSDSPSVQLSIISANWRISIVTVFFLLFSLTTFSFVTYVSNSVARGILWAGAASLYLSLRTLELAHPFFLVLLVALLITVEFGLQKR